MAELVWKNKSSICKPHYSNTPISTDCRLITDQYYIPEHTSGTTSPLEETWYNRLIQGDKHYVLPALQNEFSSAIKLIYIDPPFMTGRTFTNGQRIAYKDTWRNNLDIYLQWLYETLQCLYDLLAPDGSLYLHLDWRVVHYAKIILDEVFGFNPLANGPGFKNEITWHYQSGGRSNRSYARKHDTILFYTKSGQYCFHSERASEKRGSHKRNHMRKEVGIDGKISWTIRSAGHTYSYHEDTPMSLADVWSDISHLHQKDPERTGYATQKPEALLERILLVSSEENDLVLDCFCGSGVTAVVAERLGRRWIVSDKNDQAITITRERLLRGKQKQPFAQQHISTLD
jgi:site-specific DNA-methyltransferase (adenine-specific)/adenine-specific DNA-methyltransferase